MEQKIIIEREVVIGFVVVMDECREYSSHPIIGDHEGYFDSSFGNPIYENQKIIGVLPAPQNTFKIWGHTEGEDAIWVSLGYEFLGAYAPNWEEIYPKRKQEDDDLITAGTGVSKSQRTEFKKLREILHETTDVYGEVLEETVLAAAETQGLGDAPRVLDMLKRLKEQGEIYAPKEGVWVRS